ncbi:mitochondrial cardiolipin hydrolase-like [Choristoneura fumiferana]|uniref:mitochondrial cardiolipin hydrolase-like n=1 Tax=Choristoneura fumiferana TaxID=7141 RepID=UPI003D1589A3
MDWKSAKIILASTATAVVASQVAKKVFRYFFNSEKCAQEDVHEDVCTDVIKNREINDVILFSDDMVRHAMRPVPNNDMAMCESRELNCYKLIKYIKSSRETLDVCMYLITSSQIAEAIIRLGQKHVLVRILVDSDMANTSSSQIKKLKEYSFIQVQTNKNPNLMHHKFCIVDGPRAIKRKIILKTHAENLNVHAPFKGFSDKKLKSKPVKGFVMSGSLNWSTHAMISNHDSVIVTSQPNIVGKFEKEFESLWVEDEPALGKAT